MCIPALKPNKWDKKFVWVDDLLTMSSVVGFLLDGYMFELAKDKEEKNYRKISAA